MRYRQINNFERHLAENDVTILKFYLCISKKEQKARLELACNRETPIRSPMRRQFLQQRPVTTAPPVEAEEHKDAEHQGKRRRIPRRQERGTAALSSSGASPEAAATGGPKRSRISSIWPPAALYLRPPQ